MIHHRNEKETNNSNKYKEEDEKNVQDPTTDETVQNGQQKRSKIHITDTKKTSDSLILSPVCKKVKERSIDFMSPTTPNPRAAQVDDQIQNMLQQANHSAIYPQFFSRESEDQYFVSPKEIGEESQLPQNILIGEIQTNKQQEQKNIWSEFWGWFLKKLPQYLVDLPSGYTAANIQKAFKNKNKKPPHNLEQLRDKLVYKDEQYVVQKAKFYIEQGQYSKDVSNVPGKSKEWKKIRIDWSKDFLMDLKSDKPKNQQKVQEKINVRMNKKGETVEKLDQVNYFVQPQQEIPIDPLSISQESQSLGLKDKKIDSNISQ